MKLNCFYYRNPTNGNRVEFNLGYNEKVTCQILVKKSIYTECTRKWKFSLTLRHVNDKVDLLSPSGSDIAFAQYKFTLRCICSLLHFTVIIYKRNKYFQQLLYVKVVWCIKSGDADCVCCSVSVVKSEWYTWFCQWSWYRAHWHEKS